MKTPETTFVFQQQSLHVPVVNTKDGATLGESSIAIFRKDDLSMAYLVVNVPEGDSQMLVRFQEIESVNAYCILVTLDGDEPTQQGPLSPEEYVQLLGQTVPAIRSAAPIEQVILDSQTGALIAAKAGGETLSVQQLLSGHARTEADPPQAEPAAPAAQPPQAEPWAAALSQQMSIMSTSILRLEELLNHQASAPAAAEALSQEEGQPLSAPQPSAPLSQGAGPDAAGSALGFPLSAH